MLRSLFLFLLLTLINQGLFAGKPHLYAGPMQGHTTDSSITIWLMSGQNQVLQYALWDGGQLAGRLESEAVLEKENCWRRFCPVTLYFEGLKPGTDYQLTVHSKTDSIRFIRSFSTLAGNQSEMPKNFDVMAGSCFMMGTGGITNLISNNSARPIYNAMKVQDADVMLWLGDNLYYLYEFISDRGMRRKNVETRLLGEIQGLITRGIHYSIWDDHEFGPNNSDGKFKRKQSSTRIFNAFWPNPPVMRNTDQYYYAFRIEDAEFFMLDGRYHSDRGDTDLHSILGGDQLDWLKQKLTGSDATFKLLALGNQWHNDKRPGSKEVFYGSAEFDPLMAFIDSMRIEGVILLSGDVHYTLLQKIERQENYPIYELTSSPVSSFPNKGPEKWPGSVSSYAVPGTLFTDNNYTMIGFSGNAGKREINFKCYNKSGEEVWSYTITEQELKAP